MNEKNITFASTNYFLEWISSSYAPTCVVYSTENAKNIIGKNNLTPSELLRPFGNFTGTNISFSFGENLTVNLKNFRMDFFDNTSFKKSSSSSLADILDSLMYYPGIYPEWTIHEGAISKNELDPILQRLKFYSFSWFREYEKTVLEYLNFNEHEMYQQPLAHIFICSIKDTLESLEELKKKENIPALLYEGVYEIQIPSLIIVLNDKSQSDLPGKDYIFKKIEVIRGKYSSYYVLCWDINSNNPLESDIIDYWSRYFHKLDLYGTIGPKKATAEQSIPYGHLISIEEREIFKSSILKFFNEYLKLYLQKLMTELDEEISYNKKGIKNGFLSIFKKSDKVEYVNVFNVYKLTVLEKKIYFLAIIQFFFRDYENALENLKILLSDIRNKSVEHYNSIYELSVICHFLCSPTKKDVDMEGPYQGYLKTKNTRNAFRALIVQMKMYEHLKRFAELPKVLIRATTELTMPYLSPLVFEKVSVYYLLSNIWIKKYALYQILAGISFKNTSLELKRYTLNCFGNVISFFQKSTLSFSRLKEFLNSHIGDICLNIEYFEGSVKFYKNCIELSTVKSVDQDQALYIRHFLKSLNSIYNTRNPGLAYFDINDLSVPEIDNSSLLVIEEQDYQISNTYLTSLNSSSISSSPEVKSNWSCFGKYEIVPLTKIYTNLTETDIIAIKNLDNVIENKQNFSNIFSKRNFRGNVTGKIYVRFNIRNPLNLILSISSLKLICEFTPQDHSGCISSSPIEYEEKSLLLEKNSSSHVTLYCIPLIAGKVTIKGLEIGLYKIALIKHYFKKKNVSRLYSYRIRKKSTHNQERRNSHGSYGSQGSQGVVQPIPRSPSVTCHQNPRFSHKKDIYFDIVEHSQDIKITFPFGTELNLFLNELLLMPIIIRNNSNTKLKRFCLFFNDIAPVRETEGNLTNGVLCNYIFREMDMYKDTEVEVIVPIVPVKVGETFLKVVVKFEEESKLKEIEIKRFLIKLNISSSIKFNFNEEIINFDSSSSDEKGFEKPNAKSTLFTIHANGYIENRESMSNLKIDRIYYNSNHLMLSNTDWKIIENDTYYKLYNNIQFRKFEPTIPQTSAMVHPVVSNIFKPVSIPMNNTDCYMYEFLDEKVKLNQPHIVSIFNQMLSKDHMLFYWSSLGKSGERISGLVFYECRLKVPSINKCFLKTVFKNSSNLAISQEKISKDTLITLTLTFNMKGFREISDISFYEISVNDEDYDFTWIGLKKYKILNQSSKTDVATLNFNCLTSKKGSFEINKLNVTLYPKGQNEKAIVLSNVPWPILIDVI